jgi:uncharacterized membrane protein YfcA
VLEAVFPSTSILLITMAVLLVAEMVYVMFGFGAGLIAVGTLAIFLPELRDIVVILLLVNLPFEIWVVLSSRREIRWHGVGKICAGIAIGVPVGTWFLRFGEPRFLLTGLGFMLILTGGLFLLLRSSWSIRWPKWTGPVFGVVSGFFGGVYSTGGPPVILYYQLSGTSKAAFRGNLMAVFLFITLVRLPTTALAGLITMPRLQAALFVFPAVLLGAWLGNQIHLQIKEELFRRLVSAALVVIGLLLLL